MAKRISLHEFQAGLARRLAEARDTRASALLGIQAGHRHWLLDLTEAGEILAVPPLATVPLGATWFRGLASVRGNLFGVVDFAAFHGDAPTPAAGHARLLLVGVRHDLNCALLVSRALGLRQIEDFEVLSAAHDADQPWIGDELRDSRGIHWTRLRVSELLKHSRFLDAAAQS
ncbi:chemotaxis protein CheW [Zoogloea sp.]|uniref:chemotaxis protein CheW n=1 Tax=Zoogloea sp. TaxID=49181 RepID=UPI0026368C5C|nr:chemotaxis protein CheW [Zoogloea sp.]MDD3352131.1 chemotaxis protein CheW [Zoogloea sp.]